MKKILFLPLFLLILLSFCVSANTRWSYEANTINSAASGEVSGYATNYPIYTNITTYNSCEFSGSDYTPLIDDIDIDGLNEIITTTADEIFVYSLDCELEYTLQNIDGINAMPIIANFDNDVYQDIVILGNTSITTYELSTPNDFVKSQEINFTAYTSSMIDPDAFGCDIILERCLVLKVGRKNATVVDFSGEMVTLIGNNVLVTNNFLDKNFVALSPHEGISWINQNSGNDYLTIPDELITGERSVKLVDLYNVLAPEIQSITMGSTGGVNSGLVSQSNYVAQIGGINRVLSSQKITTTVGSPRIVYGIYSLSNSPIFENSISLVSADWGLSNWVVGDYFKTGNNIACIFARNNSVASDINSYINCYNSVGVNVLRSTITNSINLTLYPYYGALMGDFVPDKDVLSFALIDGVYYINDSNVLNKFFDTGITPSPTRNGRLITAFSNANGDPAIVYSDTSYGYILSIEGSFICGDGNCEGTENPLVCPADCGIEAIKNSTFDPCITNNNCLSGKCSAGYCVLKNDRETCTSGSQCLSGGCKNGFCTKSDLWSKIDASKTENFGSTRDTNNFISFIIMATGLIAIIWMSASAVGGVTIAGIFAGLAWFIISGIFFAIVGWLSIFMIFGLILFIALVVFVMVLLNSQN